MTTAPKCKLCQVRHWSYEPHVFSKETAASDNEPITSTPLVAPIQLALPDPNRMAAAAVRTDLIPRLPALREQIRERGDVGQAEDLRRRLDAFQRYVQDRGTHDDLAAEARRTEILIGQMLPDGRRESLARDSLVITKDNRARFRLMAAHEKQVEEWLGLHIVSRAAILKQIAMLSLDRPQAKAVTGSAVCNCGCHAAVTSCEHCAATA